MARPLAGSKASPAPPERTHCGMTPSRAHPASVQAASLAGRETPAPPAVADPAAGCQAATSRCAPAAAAGPSGALSPRLAQAYGSAVREAWRSTGSADRASAVASAAATAGTPAPARAPAAAAAESGCCGAPSTGPSVPDFPENVPQAAVPGSAAAGPCALASAAHEILLQPFAVARAQAQPHTRSTEPPRASRQPEFLPACASSPLRVPVPVAALRATIGRRAAPHPSPAKGLVQSRLVRNNHSNSPAEPLASYLHRHHRATDPSVE